MPGVSVTLIRYRGAFDPRRIAGIATDDVQLWLVPLRGDATTEAGLLASLSAAERARAERYRFVKDRRQYVFARGVLRTLLGGYLGKPPAKVEIGVEPSGKPLLCGADRRAGLCFNVSHSHQRAFYGFRRDDGIGVDVEYKDEKREFLPLARRFFHPAEYRQLRQTPPRELVRRFYSYWTCKEAFLKMRGTGLRQPLDGFVVSGESSGRPAISWPDAEPESRQPLTLDRFQDDAYAFAWCVPGAPARVICHWLEQAPSPR